jgi:hypothetical protein
MTITWTLVTSGNASILSLLKVWMPKKKKKTIITRMALVCGPPIR